MIARLFGFHGGIKPESHKSESAGSPIRPAPIPSRLVVPLRQSARAASECLVAAGQKVLKGERIGAPEGVLGTAVHAPTSGTVIEVANHPMPHPSGLDTLSVVIEPDGEDRWIEHAPFDWRAHSRDQALAHLRDCGIVGLGGAAFPSHIKLGTGRGIDVLILNGAECEPWITCDDRLMRERAADILAGAQILRELIGAPRLIVGIEDNKPEAIAAMREAAKTMDGNVEVVAVPTLYPAGGEKQLIRVLTGIEVPYGRLGGEFGVQCFNVGTAYAVYRAMHFGEPLVSRVLTLTGNVDQPGNFEVLIGTPVEELLPLAGPRRADTDRIIMGGPMMGFALPALTVPVVKATNCLISASQKLFPDPPPEQACIRCGACARACPAELQPFELYWHARAKNFGKAQEYHLFDCIECGCCAYVCPSHIPLVDYFRFAKSEIWAREKDKKAADQARERFEFRNWRQEREKEEKAAKLAAKAAETRAKLAEQPAAGDGALAAAEDPKKALIAAALARAKAQKAASAPKNTDDLSPETLAEIAAIDRRRQTLGLTEATDPAPESASAPIADEKNSASARDA
ncbi:electron transport complex subunit RsxC [Zoogloeaceae bacteirum Par-f-2]|uniref:electron transport complex subunit RsxC n=1 Tax=Pseudothauera hydrothermalis TaxID=2184083 RepID=UPI000C7E49DF|nr:electron transport complex subunit RsxC [Pseudothauera hydrothermalis]AUM00267.1 electron transport complex subunit RsxC [Rhodocyclaceae bacterium]AVZ79446.1 electron transport complex subunit RsxC [Zoogloeaceae bacteirum Par-f-2]